MKYSDYIQVNENFQTSINLEYDLNRIDKIKSYIPTEQSIAILGSFLKSYYYKNESQNRSTVLIGPYGRGKSHLLLILTALTSLDLMSDDPDAGKVQAELCRKIKNTNKEIGVLSEEIIRQKIRVLPVIVNSNTTDINQAFLAAMKVALERAGLERLLPSTYFDAAVNVIDKWENAYPDAYSAFSDVLSRKKTTIDDLRIRLKQFDQQAYTAFCECYPVVTAGAAFNPIFDSDVVKLYTSVVSALIEQTGYCGIHVIFDEFSKFLETNLDNDKMLNFKIIQDLSEAATRSGSAQIHFTCITHKPILDYSSSDSFKAVEGRFRKIQFIASAEQSFELIANAIPKTPLFGQFIVDHKDSLRSVEDAVSVANVFSDMSADASHRKIIIGCFPLAPISSFALLRISELVGQNERSLFTFLAKATPYSLPEFLAADREKIEFYTVDGIYDYFSDLMKAEVFNTALHGTWSKAEAALRGATSDDQRRILKAIAIISIIQDDRLKSIPAHIRAALLMDDHTFAMAITPLLQNHILAQRESSEYVMLTSSGVDVQKNIDAYINTKISRINTCELLEQYFPLGYLLPREYNDKYSMMRFFKKAYISAAALLSYPSGAALLRDYPYDGVVLYVIASTQADNLAVQTHLVSFADAPQIIVCICAAENTIEPLLKKTVAINMLKTSTQATDPHYVEELLMHEEDLQKQIASQIDNMFAPGSVHSQYMNYQGSIAVSKPSDLNRFVTAICLSCYNCTPVVNNEMVNKSTLNSQNIKGRNIVATWILEHADDEIIPCMPGAGPEVSIFKTVFERTGLATSDEVHDRGINAVLKLIGTYITGCTGSAQSFATLYHELQSAPFGLRKGIIPLFLAFALRKHAEDIVLYFHDREVELSAPTLTALNEDPDSYSMLVEVQDNQKREMLDTLAKAFMPATTSVHVTNRVYSVVRWMQEWVRALPEYTKRFRVSIEGSQATDAHTNLLRTDLLKFDLNARNLLFSEWPANLSKNGDYVESAQEIIRVKGLLDTHIHRSKAQLIRRLTELFVPDYAGSLSNAMRIWIGKLPSQVKHLIYDASTASLISFAEKWDSFDDDKLITKLAVLLVSMSIEDWSDNLAATFLATIEKSVAKVNASLADQVAQTTSRLSISLNGQHIEKAFSDTDISPLGETLLNNLRAVFDEYNQAIDPDEQLAIIAAIIGDITK